MRNSKAVPILTDVVLQNESIIVSSEAAKALGKIGDASAVPLLITALYRGDIGYHAAKAIAEIGKAGYETISRLDASMREEGEVLLHILSPLEVVKKYLGSHRHKSELGKAAEKGRLQAVKELLSKYPHDLESRDSDGFTPLHEAAYNGHPAVAECLVVSGADEKARSNTGWTPLHMAARQGYADIVSLLLEHGAEVNDRDNKWGTTPLHEACVRGNKDVVNLLIDNGADVNATDSEGTVPLHILACGKDMAPVARLVIDAGADVNGRKKDGLTPMGLARVNDNSGMYEFLRLNVVSNHNYNANLLDRK